jgi:predicted lipoprotein with Yx(FWY)xxD motif
MRGSATRAADRRTLFDEEASRDETEQPMTGRTRAAALTAVLITTACGGPSTTAGDSGTRPATSSEATSAAPSATAPSSSPTPVSGTAITTADSEFGEMLFDQPGQAIYLFDKESSGRPDCYGECATAWPPVLTTGTPQPMGAVRAELLGTVARDDGSMQVTYAGHPLYYYAHEGPGQVLCHDVVDFGGRWLVVTPEGAAAP